MNLKKLLSAIGLLTIAAPASLSVVACGSTDSDPEATNIINAVNQIEDLEIDIAKTQNQDTVFNILNHAEIGLAATLAVHNDIPETFKQELFKLDTKNVYNAKEDGDKITEDDLVETNHTYFFQFTYKDTNNNKLIPVSIISTEEEEEQAEADALKAKIDDLKDEFIISDQEDAENQITEKINALKAEESKLTIESKFQDFVAPTRETDGTIKVLVTIKNKEDAELASTSNTFTLKITQENADLEEANDLKVKLDELNKLTIPVIDQEDAENQITEKINALKEEGSKLIIDISFSDYLKPVEGNDGLIDAEVSIKNANEQELATISITVMLTLPE